MAVWGGLTNSCEKKRGEKQRRKGKIKASECRVPKDSKEREESLPQRSIEIEERNREKKIEEIEGNRGKQQNGKD